MPSVQRGSLDKRGKTWRARYRDEPGHAVALRLRDQVGGWRVA